MVQLNLVVTFKCEFKDRFVTLWLTDITKITSGKTELKRIGSALWVMLSFNSRRGIERDP